MMDLLKAKSKEEIISRVLEIHREVDLQDYHIAEVLVSRYRSRYRISDNRDLIIMFKWVSEMIDNRIYWSIRKTSQLSDDYNFQVYYAFNSSEPKILTFLLYGIKFKEFIPLTVSGVDAEMMISMC